MGHKRLGYLPKSKRWRDIVYEIGEYTAGDEHQLAKITNETLKSVQSRFNKFDNDPSIQAAFEFLLKLSIAFRKNDPIEYLKKSGILDSDKITLLKILRGAQKFKKEEVVSFEYQTLAKQSIVDAINTWYMQNLEYGVSLFSDTVEADIIFRKAGTAEGFCEISRLFFAKLTERYLKYFLEREASAVIQNIEDREKFSEDIEKHVNNISKHAFETAKITQSYTAGWYNKNAINKTPDKGMIANFISYALGKIKSELVQERRVCMSSQSM